jgi:dipeptidyl aminopeptidase/acylaminoacyl peptidase
MLQFKRTHVILGLLLLPATGLTQQGLTRTDLSPPDPVVERELPHYLESRSARCIGWLADGTLLIATRFGDAEQIHRVRIPLGAREQLTFEREGVLAATLEAQHDGWVMLSPRPSGTTALLLQAQPGQPARLLTDGRFRDGTALFAHDGQRIAFTSNRSGGGPGSTGREREIDLLDTAAITAGGAVTAGGVAAADGVATPAAAEVLPAPRLIAGGNGYRWHLFDWSPDDQRLLLGREAAGTETDFGRTSAVDFELFTDEVATGTLTALELGRIPAAKGSPPPVPLRARQARFAPDSHTLLLLRSSENGAPASDFWQLQAFDPGSGETRALSVDAARDIDLFDASPDGHYLAYASNEGGQSRLTLVDQQRKLDLNPTALPPGVISSLKFDAAGKHLALTLESARAPRDVYVLEPDTQQVTRWTQSELGPLDPARLVIPALVRFPTWDRVDNQPRMLSAYAYRPHEAAAASAGNPVAPHPVLILLRTGGGTQYRPGFEPLVQFLVNELGFVVLAPNVRGSAGFGRGFAELARGELRDDAARDVGSLLVWVGLQHELDFNHIFVMGEGYGSYLALASLAQYGDRLRGGIAAFPPHLGSLSGLTSIRRPVLLVHGRSDPDVPAYEVEQLAARLRTGGAAVQYLAAADEGAWFHRKPDRDAYYEAAANFLAQLAR